MRFAVFIGLMLAAYDCLEKARGTEPQFTFAADQIWIWLIPSIGWSILAVGALFRGVE